MIFTALMEREAGIDAREEQRKQQMSSILQGLNISPYSGGVSVSSDGTKKATSISEEDKLLALDMLVTPQDQGGLGASSDIAARLAGNNSKDFIKIVEDLSALKEKWGVGIDALTPERVDKLLQDYIVTTEVQGKEIDINKFATIYGIDEKLLDMEVPGFEDKTFGEVIKSGMDIPTTVRMQLGDEGAEPLNTSELKSIGDFLNEAVATSLKNEKILIAQETARLNDEMDANPDQQRREDIQDKLRELVERSKKVDDAEKELKNIGSTASAIALVGGRSFMEMAKNRPELLRYNIPGWTDVIERYRFTSTSEKSAKEQLIEEARSRGIEVGDFVLLDNIRVRVTP